MIAVRRLMVQPDVREKVTRSILETLSDLPDNQKKMFIWKHYRGWSAEKIAAKLQCSLSEVESGLGSINLAITAKAGSLLS